MGLPNIIQQINSKLPLSGGTMTGIITRSGYLARSGNESNILAMISGTDVKHGAGIWLAGNSYSGSVPAGAFRLQCYNPTTQVYTSLTGTNTGSLTWNGGEVITSKGGSITGNLAVSGMYCNKLSSSTTWGVGTTWNDAPSISLYGPNETSSGIPNCFSIRAGANKYALTGKPEGNLYWGGSKVLTEADKTIITQWGLPNYNAIISGIGSTYTAPHNGFVSFNKSGTGNATVNGITVYLGGNDAYNEGNVTLFLKKGDTIVMGVDVGTICFVPLYHGG